MNVVNIPRRFALAEWGGTETAVLEGCKALMQLGHRATIMCPEALADRRRDSVQGVDVRRFPYHYPYTGLSDQAKAQLDRKGGNLFSLSLMSTLLREPSLDIIHLHTGKRLGGIGRTVARLRKIPYIVTLHGGVFDVPPAEARTLAAPAEGAWEWGKVLGWLVGSRRVLADADAIVCVGRAEQQQVERHFPGKRVVHIPHGVHIDRFAHGNGAAFRHKYGIPTRAELILVVARIDPQKNQLVAVRQFRALLNKRPNAHLLLIGPTTSPDYRQLVDEEISKSGLERNTTIVPGMCSTDPTLVDAYHAADVFWLPSVHEPFGIVILEAWAAGVPVVAAPVGGIPDIVEDGVTGFLASPSDTTQSVRTLHTALSRTDYARSITNAAHRRVRSTYRWRHVATRLTELYAGLLTERRNFRG